MTETASPTADTPREPGLDDRLEAALRDWEDREVAAFLKRAPERKTSFESFSGLDLKRVYTPLDRAGADPLADEGLPGRPPFTRGPYPTMYRGRPWTMRQIAGFGTGADTNQRFKYLIAQGQTGLSVDFDMPTLMGFDSDHPMSHGEVGREGVAIDTIEDMAALFEDIDLREISVSMTINPSAFILFAMYIALAQERGYDLNDLAGTIQNDILKEYIAQKEWIYPPGPSLRIVRDCITYSAKHMKRYNPINISGYHMSEAGANAVQEVAFTMATTLAYIETVTAHGIDVDDFAPRLSFFFVSQADFFEEVAKFRAARRVYARLMEERFGARKPESRRLRFHAQTAAATLTKPQAKVNLMRTTLQALSAVLGGCQSLHTNGLDEAYAIPTEEAMKLALRTQQVIAEESNITSVVDPVGGSYYVEALTDRIEAQVRAYLDQVAELGGTLAAIDQGFFQKEIADTAYDIALKRQSGARTVIGVNKYVETGAAPDVEVHPHDEATETNQIAALNRVRETRDTAEVDRLLAELKATAREESQSILPVTIALVKARASMGDIVETLRTVFGSYQETPVI